MRVAKMLPLGIAAIENKIVHRAVLEDWPVIFEVVLHNHQKNELDCRCGYNVVNSFSYDRLPRFLEHRTAGQRILGLSKQCFKDGVGAVPKIWSALLLSNNGVKKID
jgi:hypothetical protein